jgi:hypothetical protein
VTAEICSFTRRGMVMICLPSKSEIMKKHETELFR